MGSSNRHHSSAITKLHKKDSLFALQLEHLLLNPSSSSDTEEINSQSMPIPNRNLNTEPQSPALALAPEPETATISPLSINGVSEEKSVLCNSQFLTRQEVLRCRSSRVKKLIKCYKYHYWALMEELKVQYREYYWKYGKSPFVEDDERGNRSSNSVEGSGENNRLGLGFGENNSGDGRNNRCGFSGCKSKAMALTNYCHPHILSDSKQKLYKACTYVIKSAQTGPVFCGKPILRSTIPSLCTVHFQKAQKHVSQALKKAGLNMSSSTKLAPKFHVIVAESVRQIQVKRRAMRRKAVNNIVV